MTKEQIKDFLFALITVAALMVYLEVRMSHFGVQGRLYRQVGVMEVKDKGEVLYIPVYKETK